MKNKKKRIKIVFVLFIVIVIIGIGYALAGNKNKNNCGCADDCGCGATSAVECKCSEEKQEQQIEEKSIQNINTQNKNVTIIIDPGHGSFDGGACAKDGTPEKDINLEISLKTVELLRNNDYNVIMTRESDEIPNDDPSTPIKSRKNADLKRRLEITNEYIGKNAVLISIHQNKFPDSKYSGAQMFYSENEKSKQLAEKMQSAFKEKFDKSSNRMAKSVPNANYIFKKLVIPGIIIECGFLSNEKDLAKLKTDEYKQMIAEVIADTIIEYFKENV